MVVKYTEYVINSLTHNLIPRSRRKSTAAYSMIELLSVLCILSMFGCLIFPVLLGAREKARQATCQSNIKNFMMSVSMYAQDNNECMPISWNPMAQIGPGVTAASGGRLQARGMHVELAPYLPAIDSLACPDDKGIERDPNSGASTVARLPFLNDNGSLPLDQDSVPMPLGTSTVSAFGVAYKFTKENFTLISGVGGQLFTCSGPKTVCLGKATGEKSLDFAAYSIPPPNPMPVSFFALPAQTRVVRDYLSVTGNTEKWANATTSWHPNGEMVGFADGHVKLIHDLGEERTLCDGPTSSPGYDGSCNTRGLERYN